MRLYFNTDIYGWKLTGLVGKSGKWFIGLSISPKERVDQEITATYKWVYEGNNAAFNKLDEALNKNAPEVDEATNEA